MQIAVPPAELTHVVDDERNYAHKPAGDNEPKADPGRRLNASEVKPDQQAARGEGHHGCNAADPQLRGLPSLWTKLAMSLLTGLTPELSRPAKRVRLE